MFKSLSLILLACLSTQALAGYETGPIDTVLRVPHAGGRPKYGQVDVSKSAAVTGALAIGNGGTGAATKAAGFDALSPNGTKGDITIRNSTTNVAFGVCSDGQALIADSTASTGWKCATPGANQFCAVVANPAISGFSTVTTVAAGITACSAGGDLLVTSGTYAENLTIGKQLYIHGVGHAAYINGTVTFATSSDYSGLKNLKIGGVITVNSGVNGVLINDLWQSNGVTNVDNGTGTLLTIIQE